MKRTLKNKFKFTESNADDVAHRLFIMQICVTTGFEWGQKTKLSNL